MLAMAVAYALGWLAGSVYVMRLSAENRRLGRRVEELEASFSASMKDPYPPSRAA